MAEEGLLLSHTEDLLASPSKSSSSLLSEISNASTRPFVLAFTVGSCGAFTFGCIVGYTAPTQSSIMKDLNLSIADFSLFGSILTVGLILGALICGKLTDLVGRVYTIWITNILVVIGWFTIAFAKGVWLLDLGRLLQGISVGISAYLGPIYISEIAPRNLRGGASSLVQLFAGVGISVFYVLGTVVAWRNLAILGSIPSLLVLPLLFFIPESPRWLAKIGREKEVEAVLVSLRGAKSNVSDEAAEILEYTQHVKQQQDVDGRDFFKLFQRKYALPLTIGVVLISLPQLGGLNGYTFFTDSIFTSTGVSSDVGFILTSIVQMSGGILGVLLVDISGRRSLLLVSEAGMFLGCLATAISFFLQKNNCWKTGTPILALISVMVYFGSYGLGMGPIPWIIASEIYPVDVKGAAGTVCNLVSSISSWLVSYSFNFLLQWSSTGIFVIFAAVIGLGLVFTAKLVPETKGKSLEEIQSHFTDSPPEDSTNLFWKMAEEGLLLASPSKSSSSSSSSSLLSEISNASTKPFVLAFTVGSCGAFAFGCIIGYSAPTQTSIMKDLNLSIADYSLFGSILTVGVILGALICGKLTDLVGRVYTIWITNILFLIGWFAIAFAKGVWLLDLGRLLQGISIGISTYLGPVYITEIAPRNLRGAASSMAQLFAGVGISVFYALGTVVTWRNLAILGSIPSLMILPLLFFIPESPRWLAKVGREKEVEASLFSLRGAKSDISDEAAEILEYTEHVKQQEDVDGRGFFKLFQRKYAFSLTIGVVLIALPELGGLNGYSFYTDSIFTSTGVSSDFGFISTSVVQLFGGILGTILVDVSGRRTLLLVSQAGMFLGCLATAISFFLKENHCWETGTPIMALISVMVYFGSYGSGMGTIPWIIASEIYPVDVKGAAGTVCNVVSSISSWLVAYSFNILLQWSSTGTFLMFATVTGLGFVFIAKFVPETKGKSLEEIQSFFTDPPPEDSTIF